MRFLFQGELTESSKKILRTQQLKTACLAGVSCMLVISGIVVLVAAYTTWLVLLLLLVPIVLGIIVCCTPFYSVEPPVEVLFEDEMVYITCEKFWRARNYESRSFQRFVQPRACGAFGTGQLPVRVWLGGRSVVCRFASKPLQARAGVDGRPFAPAPCPFGD